MSQTIFFEKALVTGGAGFIGSHLVDKLCENNVSVIVYDNLSSGNIKNVEKWLGNPNFKFIKGDLSMSNNDLVRTISECDVIFHLAANPEVKVSSEKPKVHYAQNVASTFNLLEAVRKSGNIKTFAFTSSSTVYGEPEQIPTPENYAPLKPISVYGASKLASEALISSYAYTYGFNAVIYRLANIVGGRMKHGVIFDFINKLKKNGRKLEILGDGTQTKSYLDVEDCIDSILFVLNKTHSRVEIFNVGSEDQVNVREIADIICEEMKLENVKYVFTGGVDGGRGWKGDVKVMLLSIEKLKEIGWKPKLNSRQAVRKAVKELLEEEERKSEK